MNTFQEQFHREWSQLNDQHVRALAWLITSPDLLDKDSAIWWRQLGSLDVPDYNQLRNWLFHLDAHPSPLHEALKIHRFLRLGHYAENLLTYYFNHEGLLYAHGLQVHNEKAETIGEFDYLLFAQGGLIHLELATKFYLFQQQLSKSSHLRQASSANSLLQASPSAPSVYDYLGPNLNDSLGAKMQKILQRQLTLSQHEAARKLVQSRIIAARALVKGWLFYRSSEPKRVVSGVAANHCLGFWWTLAEFEQLAIPYALKLERLQWLAPAQVSADEVMDKSMILDTLQRYFHTDSTPVLVAIMKKNGELMQEFCRGMVVPNDWPDKAGQIQR
ncbi:DUF1853 family protein [Undibacterium baiyunense]|uniref:DUF1853 family protein n=1 Tax=Undibacterium baiyunense TaxID=2828731 RepID=A0A941DB92_9BURK|nr:DUF1853 family protein [Undibacterium baiyunense]MBR7745494.1 DUF1853 family protein [Undibacterium baiyunense]